MLGKHKEKTERELVSVYFNSTTNTISGPEDSLHKSFPEIFNRIDNWISGWVIKSIDDEYVNVLAYKKLIY